MEGVMRSLILALLIVSSSPHTVSAQDDPFLVLEGGTLIDGRGRPSTMPWLSFAKIAPGPWGAG